MAIVTDPFKQCSESGGLVGEARGHSGEQYYVRVRQRAESDEAFPDEHFYRTTLELLELEASKCNGTARSK